MREPKEVILTPYFTYARDPQRGHFWPKTIDDLIPLMKSCLNTGTNLIIFHNGLRESVEHPMIKFIRVNKNEMFCPIVYRWIVYEEYLRHNKHEKVFMVDSTDVEVLNNPFGEIVPDVLYVGHESNKEMCYQWMKNTEEPYVKVPDFKDVTYQHHDHLPLNAGIVGGYYDVVFDFIGKLSNLHRRYSVGITQTTDMAYFNYAIWKYGINFEYGSHINTEFKKYEYTNAWFRHK